MIFQEAEVNQTDGSQVDGGMNFLDFQGNHGSCDGTKLVLPQEPCQTRNDEKERRGDLYL